MIVKTAQDMAYVKHNFLQVKNKLLNKYSNAEDHFEYLLQQTDIFYIREKGNFQYGTRWCYYDFYIPFYRLYIEIDGKSHNSISQQKIDKEKQGIIDVKKRFLVRLTNDEVLGMSEVSLGYLIKRLCEQSKTDWLFDRFSVNDYLENLTNNICNGIQGMLADTGISVDKNQEVFMYNKMTGKIYRFDNECIAKLNMPFGLTMVRKMLVCTDYTKRTCRKYVLAYSEQECINRVKSSVGVNLEYSGQIPRSCGLNSLIPIMNDNEKERWLGIPARRESKIIETFKKLGFSIKEEKKKNRIKISCAKYLYKTVTYEAFVELRIFLKFDVFCFKVVYLDNLYGRQYNIDKVPVEKDDLIIFLNKFIEWTLERYNIGNSICINR